MLLIDMLLDRLLLLKFIMLVCLRGPIAKAGSSGAKMADQGRSRDGVAESKHANTHAG